MGVGALVGRRRAVLLGLLADDYGEIEVELVGVVEAEEEGGWADAGQALRVLFPLSGVFLSSSIICVTHLNIFDRTLLASLLLRAIALRRVPIRRDLQQRLPLRVGNGQSRDGDYKQDISSNPPSHAPPKHCLTSRLVSHKEGRALAAADIPHTRSLRAAQRCPSSSAYRRAQLDQIPRWMRQQTHTLFLRPNRRRDGCLLRTKKRKGRKGRGNRGRRASPVKP